MIDIVNVSGGVDSTTCYLLALESGKPFRAVFADVGNEHEITLEYIANLARKTGGPEVQTVRTDYTQQIAVRRYNLEKQLETGNFKPGWDEEKVKRVLKYLHPTGIPFLDMCMKKGRFPSTMKRFCTQELKLEAIHKQAVAPAICEAVKAGGGARDVRSWTGIRHDESEDRACMEEYAAENMGHRTYRPILDWTKQDCFDMLKRHGVEPNPLYKMGCGRVGCMPCLNARKEEIREIAKRFPEHIDKIREWERLVGLCSKRGISTFFCADKTPGTEETRSNIDAVVTWSMTGRGGRQLDLMNMLEPLSCSSLYGLCE